LKRLISAKPIAPENQVLPIKTYLENRNPP